MINTTYIYFLHKGDNIPFYIGKSVNPDLRIAEHRWKKKGGIKPEFVIIDEVPTNEWLFWEKWYIELFKSWGFILENKNNGGGGMVKHSNESKLKISNSLTGKKHTEETKQKMKQSALGRHHSPSQSKKLSESLKDYYLTNPGSFKGKKHSEETKNKIGKQVVAFDKKGNLVEEYPSLKAAGIAHKIHSGNIIKTIKRNGTLHGLIWKYKE
jgi:hypothetical protein